VDEDESRHDAPKVFHQDPARFRRVERIQLVGNALWTSMGTLVMGYFAYQLGASWWWLVDLVLLAMIVAVFIPVARLRWNADTPTLVFDRLGITYHDKHLGITFGDRSLDKHLTWSSIDSLEIDNHENKEVAWTAVVVRSTPSDAKSEIVFEPEEVGASESDLTDALVRFAPERLWILVDKRSPPTAEEHRRCL
jgi:hypothetical protein